VGICPYEKHKRVEMFEIKSDIKKKMASLIEFAFTFSFENSEVDGILPLQKSFISIIEHEKCSHFIYFLNYTQKSDGEIEYKEQSLKVDRLYYLEVANAAIDNKARVEIIYSIIGKRRFGTGGSELGLYLKNGYIDIDKLKIEIEKRYDDPLMDDKDMIIYEKCGKNINYYEAFTLRLKQRSFVYLKQRSISKGICTEKSFLVEIDEALFGVLGSNISAANKIELIFSQIGKIYFYELPLGINKISKDSNLDPYIHTLGAGGVDGERYERVFALKGVDGFRANELRRIYFDIYKKALMYVKAPDNTQALELARVLNGYKNRFLKEEIFDEIVSLLVSVIELLEDELFGGMIAKDHSFKEIFISTVESVGSWQNSLFIANDGDSEGFASSTIDFIEHLKYLIKSFYDRKDNIGEGRRCNSGGIVSYLNSDAIVQKEGSEKVTIQILYEESIIDGDKLDELRELENEISDAFYTKDEMDEELFLELKRFLGGYSNMINTMYEFKELGYALSAMLSLMDHTDLRTISPSSLSYLYVLSASLIKDLKMWKQNLLIEMNMDDLHYLDATFMSNIKQIEMLLNNVEENGEGVEFF